MATKLIGTKAYNLRLLRESSHNFNIPKFVILTKDTVEQIIANKYTKTLEKYMTAFNKSVSIRSSGSISTPGRMKTVLNVDITNIDEVFNSLNIVYQSTKSKSLQTYINALNMNNFEWSIIIQQMLQFDINDVSGVMTTINPITNKKELYGNVLFGESGENIMSGKVTPLLLNSLDTFELSMLNEAAKNIQSMHNNDREIEFAIINYKLWILQDREFAHNKLPYTTDQIIDTTHCELLYQGTSANTASVIGNITRDKNNCTDKILVTEYTDFEDTEALLTCKGIITETGGALSHAAIIAKQFNIPCVVGIGKSDKLIDGQLILLDNKGGIFKLNNEKYA